MKLWGLIILLTWVLRVIQVECLDPGLSQLSVVVVISGPKDIDTVHAAQCTWMTSVSPNHLLFLSNVRLPRCDRCPHPADPPLHLVPSPTDYLNIALHLSKIRLGEWVLIIQPNTFVHVPRLLSLLTSERIGDYAGFVRDGVSELAYSSMMPHVAHEFGILIRSSVLKALTNELQASGNGGVGPCAHPSDFRATESLVAMYSSCLHRMEIFPTHLESFVPFFGTSQNQLTEYQLGELVTLGPLSASEIVVYSTKFGASPLPLPAGLSKLINPLTSSKPQNHLNILFAVLTRESDIFGVAKDILSTWGSDESVWFFSSRNSSLPATKNVRSLLDRHHLPDRDRGSSRSLLASSRVVRVKASSRAEALRIARQMAMESRSRLVPPEDDDKMVYIQDPKDNSIITPNLAPSSNRDVRLVGLDLPPPPSEIDRFDSKNSTGFKKPKKWHLWLRTKVQAIIYYLTQSEHLESHTGLEWVVLADDDTYFNVNQLKEVLMSADPSTPIAVGREFSHPFLGRLLGGGPGIAISVAALRKMSTSRCEAFPVISKAVPGGDGWLGQCFNFAHIQIQHDWRFKSMQPRAYNSYVLAHAVSFHKTSITQAHQYLHAQQTLGYVMKTSKGMCVPFLMKGPKEPSCLPAFTIIGAQKCGTTSLFEYLGQHPQVVLPEEKELNVFGTPWTPDREINYGFFISHYINRFPTLGPNQVSGEASPDYLVSANVVERMLQYIPRTRIIVSLRSPIERALSAFENKKADGTLHKHLDQSFQDRGKPDRRLDVEIPDYEPPSFPDLVFDVESTLKLCPDHHQHFTMAEPRTRDECYVNPFVLHGYYAKYLKPFVRVFASKKQLFIIDFTFFNKHPETVVAGVSRFLGLQPFQYSFNQIYNSRSNRGVHSASSNARVGGVIRGVAANELNLPNWSVGLAPHEAAILERFYRVPNSELQELLQDHGFAPMSWA